LAKLVFKLGHGDLKTRAARAPGGLEFQGERRAPPGDLIINCSDMEVGLLIFSWIPQSDIAM